MHEAAHGKTAEWLGDQTAREAGHITINPMKHLDFLGSLTMILLGVRWGKPISVNVNALKKAETRYGNYRVLWFFC